MRIWEKRKKKGNRGYREAQCHMSGETIAEMISIFQVSPFKLDIEQWCNWYMYHIENWGQD